MNKKISNHQYLFSVGFSLDREEATVDISINLDPSRPIKEIEWSDGNPVKISNNEPLVTLEMEEGPDKIKIIFERFPEYPPEFNLPSKAFHLYLDEFLEAVEQGRKLLLNKK